MVRCTVCTSSCRLSKCTNSYYRISWTFCWGNSDRATLFSTTPTNNNIETTPFKIFTTNSRKAHSSTWFSNVQNANVHRSRTVRCFVSHVIVEFPNSRHIYALRTYFYLWGHCEVWWIAESVLNMSRSRPGGTMSSWLLYFRTFTNFHTVSYIIWTPLWTICASAAAILSGQYFWQWVAKIIKAAWYRVLWP